MKKIVLAKNKGLQAAGITLLGLLFAGQSLAITNCPPSNTPYEIGNSTYRSTDILKRTVDVRSAPGSAGADLRKIEEAMRSGKGAGNLIGVCVQAHSNIPNTTASTLNEARTFAQNLRNAGLANGVPVHVTSFGNTQPTTGRASEYVTATGERARIALTQSNIQQAILNHRIEVYYIYGCQSSGACIAPFSGLSAGPLLSGATLAAPGAAAAAVAAAPLAAGSLGAVAGGLAAAAAIAAAVSGGGGAAGTTP